MHRAPAVSFSVTPSRWQLRTIVALGLVALACTAGFVQTQPAFDWRMLAMVALTLIVMVVALRAWRRSAQGRLEWDGQQWHWSDFAGPQQGCRLSLLMDFQFVTLVAVAAELQKPVYLWLEAEMGTAQWRALRRAIVSSQGAAQTPVDDAAGSTSGVGP